MSILYDIKWHKISVLEIELKFDAVSRTNIIHAILSLLQSTLCQARDLELKTLTMICSVYLKFRHLYVFKIESININ